ncbi:MAG: hypothetical protein Q7U08_07270 [Flavobacteriaceae bacterium]|jgi:hypothetical protein|nr:hypothetical protein [Flavobacteriaceae bacterium]
MKSFVRNILIISFLMLCSIGLYSQEPVVEISKEKTLNETQLNIINEQKEMMKANKENFKETLTDEQKSILQNSQLSREQKREALKSSLTLEQKNMLKANQQAIQHQRNEFKNSLSTDQKMEIRNQMKKKREHIKRVVRRTRVNNIRV